MPIAGVTQKLPRLPAAVPWFHQYWLLLVGMLLTLLQAKAWLWLWPMPQMAIVSRAGEPHVNIFFYAVLFALGATICLHYRLAFRAGLALIGLLGCWVLRALMA
jgi:hypothetical protein